MSLKGTHKFGYLQGFTYILVNDNERDNMPKINLDQALTNRNGVEFKEGGAPVELGSSLLFALEHKSEGQNMQESMKCYKLRKLIFGGGEVDLASEDITLLKSKCHDALAQPAFFAVVDLLEG